MSGTLSIVATPLGNLADMSERAKATLQQADIVLCEDTRVTGKLLSVCNIRVSAMSYHQHSNTKKFREILLLLQEGKHLALVSDAGTPGISDPGNLLIDFLVREDATLSITPVPGPCAEVAALSICGFATDKYIFLGFPPHKKKRKQFFEEVGASVYTTVFYESPHRIEKAIEILSDILEPNRKVVVCRELTKKFETIYRGTIQEVIAMHIPAKGEFTIVVQAKQS